MGGGLAKPGSYIYIYASLYLSLLFDVYVYVYLN